MSILVEIKKNKEALSAEIELIKKDDNYKLYPQCDELVDCAEMILFMNQDDLLVGHSLKELQNINISIVNAIDIFKKTRIVA